MDLNPCQKKNSISITQFINKSPKKNDTHSFLSCDDFRDGNVSGLVPLQL